MEEEIVFRIEVPGADKAITSIENLTKANKELREERKKLDLDTEQGQARARQINAQLDANTQKIKDNSSALEKQRLNIGNYKGALDTLVPGLGATADGFGAMTKGALAFIATPIGAVIGALGLAIAALTAYFKGSEEGQDRLAKITTVLNVAFNKMMVVVEAVGEAIFDAGAGFGSMTDKLGIFGVALDIALAPLKLFMLGLEEIAKFTGLDKVIEDTVKTGQAIADLNDEIEARENELVVRRAQVNKEVQELREKAITQEGDLKRKTIAEAIQLEKDLAKEEKAQLDAKLKAFDLEAATTGRLTEEQKKQRAELLAAIIDAESQGAQSTIKFQKELERLDDQKRKLLEEDAAKRRELNEESILINESLVESTKVTTDEILEDLRRRAEGEKAIKDEFIEFDLESSKTAEEQQSVKEGEEQAKRVKNDKIAADQRLKTSQILFGGLEQGLRAFGIKSKGISSALALANTFLGVTEILKSPAAPFIEPFASVVRGIQVATTIATGLGAIKQINSAQFAKGGLLGTKIFHDGGVLYGPSHAQGGIPFAVGGRVGFEAEGGEAIINKRSTAMFRTQLSRINQAGGGVPFATGGITNEIARSSESATSQREIFNAISQIRPVVTVEDINIGQDRVSVIENRAQVI